jgi:hypothetical protein
MTVFEREESLLVAIHEGQRTVESHAAAAFEQLHAQGLVSGRKIAEGQYVEVALTLEGKARIPEIILRD